MDKKHFPKVVLKVAKKVNKKIKSRNCEVSFWSQEEITKEKDITIILWIELYDKDTKKRYFSKQDVYGIKEISKKQLKKSLMESFKSFLWEKQKH